MVDGLDKKIARLRCYENVRDRVIPELVRQGVTSDGSTGKYDDRKHSLRRIRVGDREVIVSFGITYYQSNEADIQRSDKENYNLQEAGKNEESDQWAYFARNIGVAVVPVTLDGSAFVGERVGTRLYPSWLNAAAGNKRWADGDCSFQAYLADGLKELKEEYGQSIEVVGEPTFVGIASHPLKGDADATWIARINKNNSFFENGEWLKDRRDKEHGKDLVKVASLAERDRLLNNKTLSNGRSCPGIMYSTDLGLASLVESDFARLD